MTNTLAYYLMKAILLSLNYKALLLLLARLQGPRPWLRVLCTILSTQFPSFQLPCLFLSAFVTNRFLDIIFS